MRANPAELALAKPQSECTNTRAQWPLLVALALSIVLVPGYGRAQSIVEISGTLTASELTSRINAQPSGPVTVRPVSGKTATVTGGFDLPRGGVTISDVTFTDSIKFGPGDNNCQLLNSRANGFYIFGADDIVLRGNYFDGQGRTTQNLIWDEPAGSFPERFVIVNNTFKNFYGSPTDHSEALFVGYSADGLIEGNTFENNGSTGHVFFTWFGNQNSASSSYPRRHCVRNNVWGPTHTAYFDIQFSTGANGERIPVSSGITVDPAQKANTTDASFTKACPTPSSELQPPVLLHN